MRLRRLLATVPLKVRSLLWRRAREQALDDELRYHLERKIESYVAGGMTFEDAQRAARLDFGGLELHKEECRDARGGLVVWIEQTVQDIRYGARVLARNRSFTAVAVISLAIGIGGTAAVFSFADALLLRPLNVPRPGEVVTVVSMNSAAASETASYPDYLDIRARSRTFAGLVAFTPATVRFAQQADASPGAAIGMLVSDNFFAVMDVQPAVGRFFLPAEHEVPNRNAVVVLSHEVWQQRFGGDPTIGGRAVWLNGMPFTVVGVTPAGFTGLDRYTRFQFYAPLMTAAQLADQRDPDSLQARDARNLTLKGRLAPGVTLSEAQAELSVTAEVLERTYPDTNRGRRLLVHTELQNRIAQAPPIAMLLLLLGLLGSAVLVVACANVAGLLAARIPMRAREVAMRLAIGADRRRVIRQLVTENVILAVMGGAASLVVAYGGIRLFREFQVPTELPIAVAFELDRRVILVSLAAALISAVLFGLIPAIRAARADLTSVVKATDGAGFRRRWGRELIVGGQVTASVVLLFVAIVVYRSVQERLDVGPGFRTEGLLLMWFDPRSAGYDDARTLQFFEQLAARARLTPGVEGATLTSYVPMDGGPALITIVPEGVEFPPGEEGAAVLFSSVDERYFDTFALPVLNGRELQESDSASAPRVAVVNEIVAERFWPGEDAVGKRFRLNDGQGPWVEVVGVARTAKYTAVLGPEQMFVYLPYRQHPSPVMALVTASRGDPAELVEPLRAMVRGIDANQGIYNTRTMAENYRLRAVVIVNVIRRLIAALGVMSLTLAVVGLYGLVTFAASRRTREIGVRMAIGARRLDVLRMMFRQGATLSLCGLAVGLAISLIVNRALAATLLMGGGGAGQLDVLTFVLVAAVTLVSTGVAIGIPAGRATRVNPTEALRAE